MFRTVIGWSFVSFIYFNVTFGWIVKHADVSVFAALVLALVVGVVVAAVDDVYRNRLFRFHQARGLLSVGYPTLARMTVLPFVCAFVATGLVARLIVVGYTYTLTDGTLQAGPRGYSTDALATFCLIVAVPLIIHWLMSLHEAHDSANGKSVDY